MALSAVLPDYLIKLFLAVTGKLRQHPDYNNIIAFVKSTMFQYAN